MNRMRLVLVSLVLAACAQLRPAANVLSAACDLGLVNAPEVQAAATQRGIPVAELAVALCALPAVIEAWDSAVASQDQLHVDGRVGMYRPEDPVSAAVRAAQHEGAL